MGTVNEMKRAERELCDLLAQVRVIPALMRKVPEACGITWKVDLTWVSSARMKALNSRYRGKNEPTDVLSFPSISIFREQGFLGDLVICLPVLKRQAREQKHTPEDELRVLLIHGLLHLIGFDHEGSTPRAKRAALEMKKWEERLLGRTAGLIHRATSGSR